jgi:hypothetical protein
MGSKEGGEVSIQQTRNQGSEQTGSHHDAKEGFQVSKKGAQGRGQGFPRKGVIKRIGLCTLIYANLVHIVLIVYMSC